MTDAKRNRLAGAQQRPAADASAGVVVVEMGRDCNNSCVFCSALERGFENDARRLGALIRDGARDGKKEIVFTGLEPTMHSKLPALLRQARDAGYRRIRVETNARRPAYEPYARELTEAGMTEMAALMPAHDEETYRRVARVEGGFEQAREGIRNVRRAGGHRVRVTANVPICEENARFLPQIMKCVQETGIRQVSVHSLRAGTDAEAVLRAAESCGLTVELRIGDIVRARLGADARRADALRQLYDPSYAYAGRRRALLGVTLNLVYHCNLRCAFCTSDHGLPVPSPRAVDARLERAIRRKAPRLVLTGGEPTLDPRLPALIARARAGGIAEVSLFSNAVRLADAGYARALKDAGLSTALISLHAADAELSDRITAMPGAFERTLAGIRNLKNLDVLVVLSCVVHQENYQQMESYVRFVARALPDTAVNFSYITPLFSTVAVREIVPRFSDAATHILRALDVCGEEGISVDGLEPHWGIPPCALGGDRRYFSCLTPVMMRDLPPDFVKREDCARCALDEKCFGVRKGYAALYGLDELNPL